ncbi:MAG: NAD(P)-dependent oxidoreductase [Anaerolineae bacterium]|nr:NAD(P)-dependent oxidoreductase [Anaerolineae bacterium]
MKVFITGGAGRIGRHTIAYLSARGYALKAIDITSFAVPGAECEVCDITDSAALQNAMQGCDVVIHLAALPLPWSAPCDEIFRINNHGTCKKNPGAELTLAGWTMAAP